jgi:hypothetical protein
MNSHLVDGGVLLGLSDDRLSKAIEAMHKHPEVSWSLEELAQRLLTAFRFLAVVSTICARETILQNVTVGSKNKRQCCYAIWDGELADGHLVFWFVVVERIQMSFRV